MDRGISKSTSTQTVEDGPPPLNEASFPEFFWKRLALPQSIPSLEPESSPFTLKPNYLTKSSKALGEQFNAMLVRGSSLGVELLEPSLSSSQLLGIAENFCPEKVHKIKTKIGASLLSELNPSELLDKIGFDVIFRWEGITYALDLTVGGESAIANKKRKFRELERFSNRIGIERTAVYTDRSFVDSDDRLLNLLLALQEGAIDIRVERGGALRVHQRYRS